VIGGLFGTVYAASAVVLDGVFLWLCLRLHRRADRRSAALLFHYSLLYLALLFAAMAIDHLV
jgi:protoheme IX farnesyltransferase